MPAYVPKGSTFSYETQHGTRWGYVIDAPGPDRQRRQRRRKSSQDKAPYLTARAAQRALDEFRSELRAGRVPVPSDGSVAGFAAGWVAALPVEGLEPSTVLHYEMCLNRLLPVIGDLRLQDLGPGDLDRAYAALLAAGSSARTVRASHVAVRKLLGEALRLGLVGEDVSARARPPRAKATKAKAFPTWTIDELRRFLAAVGDDEDIALWWLAAWSGMRRGEALALRWEDLDLDAGVVSVFRAVGVAAGNVAFDKTPKSAAGRRLVDLDSATVAVLREHRRAQAARQLMIGPGWRGTGLVFTRVDGQAMHPNYASQRWSALVARRAPELSLPVIRLHDLRHSHATNLLAAGVRPDVVRDRLGHASVAFTLDRYGHVRPGDQRAAMDQLLRGL